MLLLKVLLSLLAFLQLVEAFFPWFPDYRCILDHTCIVSQRDIQAEDGARGEVSFKLIQKLPEGDLAHDDQIRGLAARLTKKYQKLPRYQPVHTTESEDENQDGRVLKRANTYKVVTAAIPTQTNSAAIDQDGTDFSYFAQVLLGSASSPLYMLLDSGAGQSWVMGPDCTSSACKTHNSFGAGDSTTFKAVAGSGFSLAYGSGTVSGIYGNDSVSIAGITIPLTLGIANVTSNDFNAFPMDGILGLSQATGQYPNFIQALVASKALKSNLFGVDISRASDGPNIGEINFGAPDTTRYSGSLSYNSVSPNADGDWAIPMDGLGLPGKDSGITGKLAYIDTGTSYIFAPADDVSKLHGNVPGAKSSDGTTWTVPCTTTTALTFTFSGVTYNVPSEDWVGPMANGACTSNVYGTSVIANQWLLGDTFLKNVYTVFDIDGNRIGFGVKSATATSSGAITSTGGTPLSPSSSTGSPSTATTSVSGSTGSMQTPSNSGPTGSSGTPTAQTATASITSGQATFSETGTPGLNGHQTSDTSGTVAAETSTAPASSSTKSSASAHLDSSLPAIVFAVLILLTLIS